MATNRHDKVVGRRTAQAKELTLRNARKRTAKAVRHAAVTPAGYNFHTHIGRPVVVRFMPDGSPVFAWERVPSIHGEGRWRIKYEYVPRFTDPEEMARVMVRAAARKAALDAKRGAKATRVASTENRRYGKRLAAESHRKARDLARTTRQTRAVAAGRKGWTLPRRLRGRVTK